MKIKMLAVVAAVLAMAGVVQADALYWMVDTTASDAAYKGAFDSAGLYVVKNSLPANLHRQLGRQFRVKGRGKQIIERRERDRAILV